MQYCHNIHSEKILPEVSIPTTPIPLTYISNSSDNSSGISPVNLFKAEISDADEISAEYLDNISLVFHNKYGHMI